MMKLLFSALAMLMLTACVTQEQFVDTMQSWIGSTESELVSQWGPPTSVYVAPDGKRILSYTRKTTTPTTTVYQELKQKDGNKVLLPATVGGNTFECTQRFTVSARGLIESWSHAGSDCYDW